MQLFGHLSRYLLQAVQRKKWQRRKNRMLLSFQSRSVAPGLRNRWQSPLPLKRHQTCLFPQKNTSVIQCTCRSDKQSGLELCQFTFFYTQFIDQSDRLQIELIATQYSSFTKPSFQHASFWSRVKATPVSDIRAALIRPPNSCISSGLTLSPSAANLK